MADKLSVAYLGMQIDQTFWQRKPGCLSWALNANIQSFDGNVLSYTNEPSNQLCNTFPAGFIVIGTHVVLSRNETIFALVNPITGQSKLSRIRNANCNILTANNAEYNCGCIGGVDLDSKVNLLAPCCIYSPIVEENCLNFNIDYPVRMVDKITNCGYKLYIDDDFNPPRYIDLEDPIGLDACHIPFDSFSCDRIKIFKDFCIPDIIALSIEHGGNLQAGMYQGTIAYCDINGNEYTDYFQATNPVPIFDRPITVDTDYYTGKSIKFKINHNTDIFEFFKLVIIKTVNEAADYIEEGIHRVSTPNHITYTGNDASKIKTTIEKIRIPSPVYTKAKFIMESSDHLIHADLEGDPEYNFQPFASKLKLYWETVQMPYDQNNSYANPIVASRFQTYQRDEIYPFGIRFKLRNGKKTKAYVLVNREKTRFPDPHNPNNILDDNQVMSNFNQDVLYTTDCDGINQIKKRWEVYNTAYNKIYPVPYIPLDSEERVCDIIPFARGEFAYWESTERYPCDKRIWGELADAPIRHFKFPDSELTHIHDGWDDTNGFFDQEASNSTIIRNQYDYEHKSFLYPIGVRLDESVFNAALQDISVANIFNPETGNFDLNINDLICGFEIVRGNRVGNKRIIAKGMLYDVGEFEDVKNSGLGSDRKQYYANYPYNDLNPDGFLSKDKDIYLDSDPTDAQEDTMRLRGYENSEFRRFTFHSPDTHFQRPTLGTELKLETEEFGVCRGHFVQVLDHPKYKFLTELDSVIAVTVGLASSINVVNESNSTIKPPANFGVDLSGHVDMNFADMMAQSNVVRDIIEKLIPWRNFAYQFNSAGVYNNYRSIRNDFTDTSVNIFGVKRRGLELSRYLSPNVQHVNDIHPVNNFQRESSVYLRTTSRYKSYERDDTSRYTLGMIGAAGNNNLLSNIPGEFPCKNPERQYDSKIRSFYSSIKREIPDQYGNIDNLRFVTTGYNITLNENGQFINTLYPIFGGDTFIGREAFKIKHPFWTQNMVGRPDGSNFDYNLVPNLAYPTYYIGTSADEIKLKNIFTAGVISDLLTGLLATTVAAAVGDGFAMKAANAIAQFSIANGGSKMLINLMNAFLPKNNLDCDTTGIDPNNLPKFEIHTRHVTRPPVFGQGGISVNVPDGVDLANIDVTNPDFTLFYQSGKFYLASYGIPQYFVESDINLDFRHGTNLLEENFYPNVSHGIPDDWLQETYVPIKHDNKYHYNATYSIQNSQDLILAFNNYKFDKLCQSDFPNRIIYSEKSNNEENFDNWLKYKANNYYDFDKSNGKITGIDSLENNKIIVRFENTFQMFNTRITLQSNSPYEVAISNSGMFTQEPIEFSKTNTGNAGSQHIAFEQTPHGSFWVDAKRGEVYQLQGTSLNEISRANYNWFKEHLPFKILRDFPDFPVDNSYKNIGLSICWDERNERLFITKNDFRLLPKWKDIVFQSGTGLVYIDIDVERAVEFSDPKFFSNESFTISWSPVIGNWVSFYSFLPNYYVSLPTHFQTGIHNSIWNHNLSNLSYQVYYSILYPYIIEIPISNIPQSEILKAVTINTDVQKYSSETDFYSLKSTNTDNYNIFFNKAIVYNKEQCSGLLTLTETPINNMRLRMSYPIYNIDNINILYSKYNKVCTFNSFYDITKNYNLQQPVFTTEWSQLRSVYPMDKVLNIDNTNYRNTNKKIPIRSNECYVRLIQDVHQRYKFTNIFEILNQEEQKNQNGR